MVIVMMMMMMMVVVMMVMMMTPKITIKINHRGFPLPSYTWYKVNPVTGAQEELSAAPTLFPRHTVNILLCL